MRRVPDLKLSGAWLTEDPIPSLSPLVSSNLVASLDSSESRKGTLSPADVPKLSLFDLAWDSNSAAQLELIAELTKTLDLSNVTTLFTMCDFPEETWRSVLIALAQLEKLSILPRLSRAAILCDPWDTPAQEAERGFWPAFGSPGPLSRGERSTLKEGGWLFPRLRVLHIIQASEEIYAVDYIVHHLMARKRHTYQVSVLRFTDSTYSEAQWAALEACSGVGKFERVEFPSR